MRSILAKLSLVLTLSSTAAFAQTHTVIVLSHGAHTVYELDPTTGKILHEFAALYARGDTACKAARQACEPHEAAISPDGRTIFASVPAGPFVEILDGITFKEKGRVETELFTRSTSRPGRGTSVWPHGVALNTDGSKLYVTSESADVPGLVVYDVKAGKAIKKIDVPLQGGHYLQVQPGTDKLYFPHSADNRVVVIDTKTDRITKIIPVKGGPTGVAFMPNGEVWLAEDGDGSVTIVDSKTDEVVKVIPTGGKGESRVSVSPDGRYAAATHNDSRDVMIIDGQTKAVVATVMVGGGSLFPLFSPDGTKVYVMNAGANAPAGEAAADKAGSTGEDNVCVVDVKTAKVIARYKVGGHPFGGGLRFPNGRTTAP
jgi:YVTN family beta-propeller protein